MGFREMLIRRLGPVIAKQFEEGMKQLAAKSYAEGYADGVGGVPCNPKRVTDDIHKGVEEGIKKAAEQK